MTDQIPTEKLREKIARVIRMSEEQLMVDISVKDIQHWDDKLFGEENKRYYRRQAFQILSLIKSDKDFIAELAKENGWINVDDYEVIFRKLDSTGARELLAKEGYVKQIGCIRELPRAAADPEAFVADGIGVSWERSAPIFREFMEAGYVQVELPKLASGK